MVLCLLMQPWMHYHLLFMQTVDIFKTGLSCCCRQPCFRRSMPRICCLTGASTLTSLVMTRARSRGGPNISSSSQIHWTCSPLVENWRKQRSWFSCTGKQLSWDYFLHSAGQGCHLIQCLIFFLPSVRWVGASDQLWYYFYLRSYYQWFLSTSTLGGYLNIISIFYDKPV